MYLTCTKSLTNDDTSGNQWTWPIFDKSRQEHLYVGKASK
jgi:hypothetical protein